MAAATRVWIKRWQVIKKINLKLKENSSKKRVMRFSKEMKKNGKKKLKMQMNWKYRITRTTRIIFKTMKIYGCQRWSQKKR